MKLTKFGHACVRLEGPGGRLVIDPGALTEDAAVEDADGILVTHEHFDHFAESHVRTAAEANRNLRVWTVPAVAELLTGLGDRLQVVGHGDVFAAAGFEVEAFGTWHGTTHPDMPPVRNTGFLVDGSVFHPGDALTVPDRPVKTLLMPVHTSWCRTAELIDWVRDIAPARAVPVHDSALNGVGVAMADGLFGKHGPGINSTYVRLDPMDAIDDA
ncbi:MBL fold metallo-hydrolase [Streptomyces sp. HPF1205]|uniref:MBL fold metallo-hydrolase n=1 Tax=Streptomyces sp. HPF1205 TaxID=2873262 RepID=UPI001CEE01C3|nr:MBL fold metallo-hydrolase [Streptomyces sp. HPF1205]